MTVFKAFLKILNKNKGLIILYTTMLLIFAGSNMSLNDSNTNYVSSKPKIVIIDNDNDIISKNMAEYLKDNCKVTNVKNIDDALFNRQIHYVIYIPKNYTKDLLSGKNPTINVKKTNTFESSLAEMIFTRYINVARTYSKDISDTNELTKKITDTLKTESDVKVKSKLKTNSLEKAAFYYTFLSYSIVAALVYVICIILSSFRNINIAKRNIVSSVNYKKLNLQLLISSFSFSFVLWIFYILLSLILVGNIMFTPRGLVFIVNSLLFTICATGIAFLIGNLVNSKNAIGGIVNVVAVGSSFLCGVFVPMEWLPSYVVNMGKILPTYWYVDTNNYLKTIEDINSSNIGHIIINMCIVLGFTIVFIILSNIIYNKKRKIN